MSGAAGNSVLQIAHFYGGMIHHGVTGFKLKTTVFWPSSNNWVGEDGNVDFYACKRHCGGEREIFIGLEKRKRCDENI